MVSFRVRTPRRGSVRVRNAGLQIIRRPVGRLGLGFGLGSGPHVVGRLGRGMQVSASFQIIPRPVG